MSNREDILKSVQDTLMETFSLERDEVGLDSNLYSDLDLDSLDAIDLAVELTNRTNMKFDNDDLRQIRMVSDIIDTIIRKQKEAE